MAMYKHKKASFAQRPTRSNIAKIKLVIIYLPIFLLISLAAQGCTEALVQSTSEEASHHDSDYGRGA